MQKLEERTAKFIRKSLREKAESAWCQGCCGRSPSLPRCITTLTIGVAAEVL